MFSDNCQFCHSGSIKRLKDGILYCPNCEIYYVVRNGKQYIKSLPLVEIEQRSLNLCSKCMKSTKNSRRVCVKTFSEYYKNLPFCKKCRIINKVFIKNFYCKSFILYKKMKRIFGLKDMLCLLILSCILIRYLSVFPLLPALVLYIDYRRYSLSFIRCILLILFFYQFSHYEFVKLFLIIYCLYNLAFAKSIFFEVPVDTCNAEELDGFINKLSINTSFEKRQSGNKKSTLRKSNSMSMFNLKRSPY